MNYLFRDLVDIDVLADLCQKHTDITGITIAILDVEGKVLIATGWQDICSKFHRVNEGTASRCLESDTILAGKMVTGKRFCFYQCRNGLVDGAVRIMIGGHHVGNLYTGQFFYEPPDKEFFRQQAVEFGFDEKSYLHALSKVPIFTEQQATQSMDFLAMLAEYIGESGLNRLRLMESNKELNREIEQRKHAQHALTTQTELVNNILNNIPHSVFWKDRDHVFLGCNQVFAESVGISRPQDIVGKTDRDLAARRAMADRVAEVDREIISSGKALLGVEENITQADGQPRTVITSKVPLKNKDGGVSGLLGIHYDITDLKQAQEAKSQLEDRLQRAQKMEAVGTLAGGIAHDFNNILGIIIGYTEFALDHTGQGRDASQELDQVLQAALRAKDLVNRILAYSRKTEPTMKFLKLNREIEQVAGILERTFPKMIKVRLDLAEDLEYVMGDPGQMEQVLLNLSSNARDAMLQGGELSIATANTVLDEDFCAQYPDLSPGNHVTVTVSDTGRGMDAKTLEQIFDPFFTTKDVGQGTGLGLNMILGIVKAHGGEVICHSEPGQGTTFQIHLPAAGSVSRLPGDDASAAAGQALERGHGTILLVDDEEPLRELGTTILGQAGYQVVQAGNGEKALAAYQADPQRFDLVILDMSMPGMGGLRCLQELLVLDPGARVLVASGYAGEGTLQDTLEAGALAYITKPYRKMELLAAVRSVMNKPRSASACS